VRNSLEAKLTGDMCPYFIDWLLNSVVLVGIQAPNRDSGYRIFESMNDRGARLTAVDLVKSFLLSNVGTNEEELNISWREMLAQITTIRDDADAPKKFLKAVLVGRYADVTEAESQDAVEIDTALNIWVRRNKERRLRLRRPDDFFRFVEELIDLSKHYVTFLQATRRPHADHRLSALFYNDRNGITGQMELILAAVRPSDTLTDAKAKAALVGNYLDRLYVIRALNEEPVETADFVPEIRRLIPTLRSCSTPADVAKVLAAEITDEGFESVLTFGLRGNNKAQVRYMLARLTAHTEVGCGKVDESEAYLRDDRAWHIEHLWPNQPDLDTAGLDTITFRLLRSRLGGLALLHRRDNTSLRDIPFSDKINRYARQNNLLAVLSPGHRKNNTFARDFAQANDVQSYFRDFGTNPDIQTVVNGRAELYRRLVLRIWDPQTLGLPVQQPAAAAGAEDPRQPEEVPDPSKTTKSRAKLNTDVARMVRKGLITPESEIVLTHNGKEYFAAIDSEGYVRFPAGDTFSKPDEAGKIITQRRCDGLGEWRLVTATGERISLREVRDGAKAANT